MTASRFASRPAFRATEGDERLQALLMVLLALCILAGWLLIRELAPAGDGPVPPRPGIDALAPGT